MGGTGEWHKSCADHGLEELQRLASADGWVGRGFPVTLPEQRLQEGQLGLAAAGHLPPPCRHPTPTSTRSRHAWILRSHWVAPASCTGSCARATTTMDRYITSTCEATSRFQAMAGDLARMNEAWPVSTARAFRYRRIRQVRHAALHHRTSAHLRSRQL